jgi:predicted phosphodiesterase
MIFLLIATAAAREFFMVTDLHLDIFYDETASMTSQCHRSNRTVSARPLGRAGCDSPEQLVRSTLQQMQSQQKSPEFIIVTGDLVGHFTYSMLTEDGKVDTDYNKLKVQETYRVVANLFKEYFPKTQVILTHGNNDGYGDYWNPSAAESREFWGSVLPYYKELNPDISASFIEGGYYLTYTKTKLPVIVLNSNFFSVKDTPLSDSQQEAQFIWLEKQLESVQQPAFIAMHIPPGNGKYNGSANWQPEDITRFLAILRKHPNSYSLVLAGHLHSQTFQLFENSAVLVHSSVSPLFGNNPMFRLYRSTELTYDFEDYSLDLYSDTPTWQLEYSFSTLYGSMTLDFKDVYNLLSTSSYARLDYIKKALGASRSNLPQAMLINFYLGTASWKMWQCTMQCVDPEAYAACIG